INSIFKNSQLPFIRKLIYLLKCLECYNFDGSKEIKLKLRNDKEILNDIRKKVREYNKAVNS
uniref:hypothetical protein n=1 Tax=Clostridium beijerinckii TaxID=1520 RepID=UPI0022E43EE2